MIRYINKTIEYSKKKKYKTIMFGLIFVIVKTRNIFFDNVKYFISKIRNQSKDRLVNINKSYLMYINPKDKGISKELYIYRTREHFSTEYIRKILTEDEIVIDIGANLGYYALLEAQLAKKGYIYAIEPVPENMSLLKKNIQVNGYKNIDTFQVAISDTEAVGKMYVYDNCNWSSFTKNSSGAIIGEIEVPTITLDGFLEFYAHQVPTFIRMDVEGFEYQVIKGATKVLSKCMALKLFIEIHPHLMSKDNTEELISILKNSGFNVKAIFLDPVQYYMRNITIVNRLRKEVGLPVYGFWGESYGDLYTILKEGHAPTVFFEK